MAIAKRKEEMLEILKQIFYYKTTAEFHFEGHISIFGTLEKKN